MEAAHMRIRAGDGVSPAAKVGFWGWGCRIQCVLQWDPGCAGLDHLGYHPASKGTSQVMSKVTVQRVLFGTNKGFAGLGSIPAGLTSSSLRHTGCRPWHSEQRRAHCMQLQHGRGNASMAAHRWEGSCVGAGCRARGCKVWDAGRRMWDGRCGM